MHFLAQKNNANFKPAVILAVYLFTIKLRKIQDKPSLTTKQNIVLALVDLSCPRRENRTYKTTHVFPSEKLTVQKEWPIHRHLRDKMRCNMCVSKLIKPSWELSDIPSHITTFEQDDFPGRGGIYIYIYIRCFNRFLWRVSITIPRSWAQT